MLTTALQAREPLYRDAAAVVTQYNATVGADRDPELIEELLASTLIVPLDTNGGPNRMYSTLFELYILFAVIRGLESQLDQRASVSPIAANRGAVATFSLAPETTVSIYYEQAATADGFSFLGGAPSNPTRREEVQRRYVETADLLPGTGGKTTTNRPDVLLVVEHDDVVQPELAFPIECKYQKEDGGNQTVKRGIREALEYIAYMRHDGVLVYPDERDWYGAATSPQGAVAFNDRAEPLGTATTPALELLEASAAQDGAKTAMGRWLDRVRRTLGVGR